MKGLQIFIDVKKSEPVDTGKVSKKIITNVTKNEFIKILSCIMPVQDIVSNNILNMLLLTPKDLGSYHGHANEKMEAMFNYLADCVPNKGLYAIKFYKKSKDNLNLVIECPENISLNYNITKNEVTIEYLKTCNLAKIIKLLPERIIYTQKYLFDVPSNMFGTIVIDGLREKNEHCSQDYLEPLKFFSSLTNEQIDSLFKINNAYNLFNNLNIADFGTIHISPLELSTGVQYTLEIYHEDTSVIIYNLKTRTLIFRYNNLDTITASFWESRSEFTTF